LIDLRENTSLLSAGTGAAAKGRVSRKKIRHLTVERFLSDHWKAYTETFPADRLKQTKAETYTVEGYNCRIRKALPSKVQAERALLFELREHDCELPETAVPKTQQPIIYGN